MPARMQRSKCGNCGRIWRETQLAEISDFWERVDVGGEVPSGECPKNKCGALCYEVNRDGKTKYECDDALQQAVRNILLNHIDRGDYVYEDTDTPTNEFSLLFVAYADAHGLHNWSERGHEILARCKTALAQED